MTTEQRTPEQAGRAASGYRLDRRRALVLLGGAGLVGLVGCGDDDDGSSGSPSGSDATSSTTSSTTTAAPTSAIPQETAGPYPADGSNGPDVLSQDGVVRRDITSSFGSADGTAEGVPLEIRLTVVDVSEGSDPVAGAAVYLWHCDREGRYSLYSSGVTGENYLRGVQEADDDGTLSFRSIFPGAYSGRWPHIHFEVFADVDDATGGGRKITTSQLALPQDVCEKVYAKDGYEQSVRNLSQTPLSSDNVFRDGYSLQLAKVTGDPGTGYVATLTVPV